MNKKSGARHNAGDMKNIQAIHDGSQALGADCPGAGKYAKAGALKGEGIAFKNMSDIPNLRGAYARGCWNCVNYKPLEGDWDDGQCTKYDSGVEQDWMCDAWAAIPSQPLEVVIVKDTGGNETVPLSTDSPAMLSIPNYVKSLHLAHDDQFIKDVLAVKFIGQDDVRGYSALWGDPQLVDLEREFFTPQTDFWKSVLGLPRPLSWNHAQDKQAFQAHPVVGKMVELGEDKVGMFYTAVLDRAHEYRRAVGDLIQKRVVGTSSDSAPQYVERVKMANGSVWLKQWPLFAAALTDVPCEPRMIEQGNVYWKSVGVDLQALKGQSAEASAVAARAAFEQRNESAKRDLEILKLYL